MRTNLQKDLPVCGDSTLLDAGAGFDTYLWNTGATTGSIIVKQNATYSVALTKSGCTATDTSRVKFAIPVNDFSVGKLKDSVCSSDRDSLYVVLPQTGINYNWTITGNTSVVHTGTTYQPVNLLANTTYTVTGASDAAICPVKTAIATIIVRTKLATPVLRADSVGLYLLVFAWDPVPGATGYLVSSDGGNHFNPPQTGALALKETISGLLPNQSATIQVKATGPYSCQESDVAILTDTTKNPFGDGIYVPNAFTPNGDGINDQLRVYGTAIVSVKLIIYNQWGREIFISTDLLKGWDGTYHGNNQPAGLYSYSLEAMMQDGKKVVKGGSFNLLR
jgi:gliding motility-associated-like protein